MLDKKPTKKNLIILDFDGTIFYNPNQNFSIAIPIEDILRANYFFSEFTHQSDFLISKDTEFVLITGRSKGQEGYILNLLRAFGYRIDKSYFSQTKRTSEVSENEFLISYWTEKAKLINQIRDDDDYSSIVVIDDDKIICSMLQELSFKVYQTKITKQNLSQPLSISFNRLNNFFTTQLQNSLVLIKS